MPKYRMSWTEEQWYTEIIEADNEEQAVEMLFNGEFEWPEPYGFEIQDSVVVDAIEESA